MYGVVLWSDPDERKAVIWCEDHGDLAFYTECGAAALDAPALDAGDLVQFDMTVERHLRYAHNPRLIAEGLCPDLPEQVAGVRPPRPAAPRYARESADVIPFAPRAPLPRTAVGARSAGAN